MLRNASVLLLCKHEARLRAPLSPNSLFPINELKKRPKLMEVITSSVSSALKITSALSGLIELLSTFYSTLYANQDKFLPREQTPPPLQTSSCTFHSTDTQFLTTFLILPSISAPITAALTTPPLCQ